MPRQRGSVLNRLGPDQEESMFRSSPMTLFQLYIPAEAAQVVTLRAGDLGLIQFRDLNSSIGAFQKTFTGEIQRLWKMEKRLKVLLSAAREAEVDVRPWDHAYKSGPFENGSNLIVFLDELDGQLKQYEDRIIQMATNEKTMVKKLEDLIQQHDVIAATSDFLSNAADEEMTLTTMANKPIRRGNAGGEGDSSADTVLEVPYGGGHNDLERQGGASISAVGFVTGVIERSKLAAFQRVLWRALRGNVIVKTCDIPSSSVEGKSAFVAFVHGQETLNRLKKICQAVGCSLYDLDSNVDKRRELYDRNASQIDDLQAILYNTKEAKRGELLKLADVLEMWHVALLRQKQVYATLNLFSCDSDSKSRRCFIAEGWCPTVSFSVVEASLKAACSEAGLNMVPVLTVLDPSLMGLSPPTHFPLNKFTMAFQEITDAYGIPTYGEANPSVYLIITFPFLFGVMFGDVGHGFIMAAAAAWMVIREKKLRTIPENEAWNMMFTGRYIILLMGLFSIYAGFIYNDCFSRTVPIFPSMFYFPPGESVSKRVSASYVYPFGVDPQWNHSENAMTFLNSYKMKQSVLLGLTQMFFGLFISLTNMIHFGETVDIWCIFLPQVLFMTSLFGYLGVLIIAKWLTSMNVSLLNLFIAMVLRFGAVEGPQVYPGQQYVQLSLMVIAISCIPWMLFAKPLYLFLERRSVQSRGYTDDVVVSSSESVSSTTRKARQSPGLAKEQESIGELLMHQGVHTIEFVLGSVSNTASYLRLWALSLAHAQLSDVLWVMTIGSAYDSLIKLPIAFLVWLLFTLGIMVGMEGMSAFLHALRLHWVEFNNKFYRGGGDKFSPFALRPDLLLAAANDPDSN